MRFLDVVYHHLIRVQIQSECFVHILSSNDVGSIGYARMYVGYGLASRGSNLAYSPIVVNCRLD